MPVVGNDQLNTVFADQLFMYPKSSVRVVVDKHFFLGSHGELGIDFKAYAVRLIQKEVIAFPALCILGILVAFKLHD